MAMSAASLLNESDALLLAPAHVRLEAFNEGYSSVHGYLALGVCSAGAVMNACNVYVLTRHAMAVSAVNALLFALSAADLATNAVYIPFALYFFIFQSAQSATTPSRAEERYAIVMINIGLLFHTMSMWLTVAVTAFRYVYVRHYARAKELCSLWRARAAIGATVAAALATTAPGFACFTTSADSDAGRAHEIAVGAGGFPPNGSDASAGSVTTAKPASSMVQWAPECAHSLRTVSFFLFGGVVKASACIVLAALSWLLIVSLRGANERHRRLTRRSDTSAAVRPISVQSRSECSREERGKRTTIMLVAVAVTFVAIELPQGVLVLLGAADNWYFNPVYVSLGDFFDILVLFKSAANFLIYATMSRVFRRTFRDHVLTCRRRSCARSGSAVGGSKMATDCAGLDGPLTAHSPAAGAENFALR